MLLSKMYFGALLKLKLLTLHTLKEKLKSKKNLGENVTLIRAIPWAGNKLLTLYTFFSIKLFAHLNSTPHVHIYKCISYLTSAVTLQVPFLSAGARMAGRGKVGYPPCSNSKLEIVFGILPLVFRVKDEKISTSIELLENKSQEASKAKRWF